jgi:hypothetical protein
VVALSFHLTLGAAFAAAQDPDMAPAPELGPREHRLNIAGWTLVGAGAAFPVIAVPISAARGNWGGEDCDRLVCPDVAVALTSLVLGPVMIVTGGALLLRRRSLRKSHEAEPQLALYPGPTGIAMAGTF